MAVQARPLRISRDFQPGHGGRTKYTAFSEDDPDRSFSWDEGEDVIVKARRGLGILLTQDCEIDKPHASLLFAEIRPLPPGMSEQDVDRIRRRLKYRAFFLGGQDQMAESYVDFGRLTTIEPDAVIPSDRWLSLTELVRKALREDFSEFLANDRGEDRADA